MRILNQSHVLGNLVLFILLAGHTRLIRPLSSNPNRANQSRSEPKDMPDRFFFKNLYINGIKDYNHSRERILCVKCEYVDYTSKECIDVLPAWKQAYLRSLVFDDVAILQLFAY